MCCESRPGRPSTSGAGRAVPATGEQLEQAGGAGVVQAERVGRIYERLAPRYDRGMDVLDRLLFSGGRDWVCERASGATLEVAVGTGRNLGRYPAGVRLTGIDASPAMLAIAQRRADSLEATVDLREGDAERLDFPDGCFDSVVVTLALCTIPDDGAAVAEMARVLRPGGEVAGPRAHREPSPVGPSRPGPRRPLGGAPRSGSPPAPPRGVGGRGRLDDRRNGALGAGGHAAPGRAQAGTSSAEALASRRGGLSRIGAYRLREGCATLG